MLSLSKTNKALNIICISIGSMLYFYITLKPLLIFSCQAELVESQQSIEYYFAFQQAQCDFLYYAKTIINV